MQKKRSISGPVGKRNRQNSQSSTPLVALDLTKQEQEIGIEERLKKQKISIEQLKLRQSIVDISTAELSGGSADDLTYRGLSAKTNLNTEKIITSIIKFISDCKNDKTKNFIESVKFSSIKEIFEIKTNDHDKSIKDLTIKDSFARISNYHTVIDWKLKNGEIHDHKIIHNWLYFTKKILEDLKIEDEYEIEQAKPFLIAAINDKLLELNSAKASDQKSIEDYSNLKSSDFFKFTEKDNFNRVIASLQTKHNLKLIEDKLAYLQSLPKEKTKKFNEENFPNNITNRAKRPFITYNGIAVFSITEEQREILARIDRNLKEGRSEVIEINLDTGHGKSYLGEMIERLYGIALYNQRSINGNKSLARGINIGKAKGVAYPLEELTKEGEKQIKGLSYKYDPTIEPAYIHSLSLSEIYDSDKTAITEEVDKVRKKQIAELEKQMSSKEEAIKTAKDEIREAIRHDAIINLIKQAKEGAGSSKNFIEDILKPLRISLLSKETGIEISEIRGGKNVKNIPTAIENGVKTIIQDILTGELISRGSAALSFKTSLLSLKDSNLTNKSEKIAKKVSSLESDIEVIEGLLSANQSKIDEAGSSKQLVIIDEFEHLDQELKKKLRLHLLSKGYQVILVSATPNTKALEEDLKFNEHRNADNKYPDDLVEKKREKLNKIKAVEEDFLQKLKSDKVEVKNPLTDEDNHQTIIDLLIEDIKNSEQGTATTEATSSTSTKTPIEPLKGKRIQVLLPDIKPRQIQLLLDSEGVIQKIAEATGIEGFIVKDDQGRDVCYTFDIESKSFKAADYNQLTDPKKSVLEFYSSRDVIGGDFGDLSRDVDKQIIYSINDCSTSQLQQWMARNRQNDMSKLDSCPRILRIGSVRDKDNLDKTLKFEQKKHEDIDSLHRARTRIVEHIENFTSSKLDKLGNKASPEIFSLIRSKEAIENLIASINIRLRNKGLLKENQAIADNDEIRYLIDNYRSVAKNLSSSKDNQGGTEGSKTTKLLIDLEETRKALRREEFRRKFSTLYNQTYNQNSKRKAEDAKIEEEEFNRKEEVQSNRIKTIEKKLKEEEHKGESNQEQISSYLKTLEEKQQKTIANLTTQLAAALALTPGNKPNEEEVQKLKLQLKKQEEEINTSLDQNKIKLEALQQEKQKIAKDLTDTETELERIKQKQKKQAIKYNERLLEKTREKSTELIASEAKLTEQKGLLEENQQLIAQLQREIAFNNSSLQQLQLERIEAELKAELAKIELEESGGRRGIEGEQNQEQQEFQNQLQQEFNSLQADRQRILQQELSALSERALEVEQKFEQQKQQLEASLAKKEEELQKQEKEKQKTDEAIANLQQKASLAQEASKKTQQKLLSLQEELENQAKSNQGNSLQLQEQLEAAKKATKDSQLKLSQAQEEQKNQKEEYDKTLEAKIELQKALEEKMEKNLIELTSLKTNNQRLNAEFQTKELELKAKLLEELEKFGLKNEEKEARRKIEGQESEEFVEKLLEKNREFEKELASFKSKAATAVKKATAERLDSSTQTLSLEERVMQEVFRRMRDEENRKLPIPLNNEQLKEEILLFIEVMRENRENRDKSFSDIKREKGYEKLVKETREKLFERKYQNLKDFYYKTNELGDSNEIITVGNLFNRFTTISGIMGREYAKQKAISEKRDEDDLKGKSVPEGCRSVDLIKKLPENFSFDKSSSSEASRAR